MQTAPGFDYYRNECGLLLTPQLSITHFIDFYVRGKEESLSLGPCHMFIAAANFLDNWNQCQREKKRNEENREGAKCIKKR